MILILRESLGLFTKRDKYKFYFLTGFQVSISMLDLFAVGLVGLLSSLLISYNNSGVLGNRAQSLINWLHLNRLEIKFQIVIIASAIIIAFISKTLLSLFIVRKTVFFLNSKSTLLSINLTQKFLIQPLNKIQNFSLQEIQFILSSFPNSIRTLMSSLSNLLSDIFLTIILISGLMYVNFPLTFFVLIILGTAILTLYFRFKSRFLMIGKTKTETQIGANELISEVVLGYRSIYVSGKLPNFIKFIGEKYTINSENEARAMLLPLVNKYLVEIAVYSLIFMLAVMSFGSNTFISSVSTLSIFLVSITRIAPALLRVQQNFLSLINLKGLNEKVFLMIRTLRNHENENHETVYFENIHPDFVSEITLTNVQFKYSEKSAFKLIINKLEIKPGEYVAIVGKSGSGKSTFVDLLLGILQPNSGEVLISNISPKEAIKKWPGAIAYVPQETHLFNGTIRDALLVGFDKDAISDFDLKTILDIVNLDSFDGKTKVDLNYRVGDRGSSLSGGQKQRLSIARALLTKPKILVLDEATSALDAENEDNISKLFDSLNGHVTLIVIAHRYSTIKHSERIIYFESGKANSIGSFEELRKLNSDFEYQSKLSGY